MQQVRVPEDMHQVRCDQTHSQTSPACSGHLNLIPIHVFSYVFFQVTKRENSESSEWQSWNWRSDEDLMLNGAFFTPSGQETPASYIRATSMVARPASHLINTPPSAGVLDCQIGIPCYIPGN